MQTWQKLRSNPDFREKYFIREKVIHAIRTFFQRRNYHEVETPLLVPSVIPESYLENFTTTLLTRNKEKKQLFLTSSPEASIKKLLVAGIGNCFEITKSFRNGETHSNLHNPEFTILEWYQVGKDYFDVMKECELLIIYIKNQISKIKNTNKKSKISGSNSLVYQGRLFNMTPPFIRISICEAIKKYSGIEFDSITDKGGKTDSEIFSLDLIATTAIKKGYKVEKSSTWELLFNQIFLNEIEPQIARESRPVFVYDYPKPMAGLAKLHSKDPRLAQRFELYISGLELGDCYTELTDWKELEQRFKEQKREIERLGKSPVKTDEEFINALKIGLPDCSGMAMGIDRLVMLFTGIDNIADCLFFPISEILN